VAFTDPGASLTPYVAWVDTIGSFIKSIDKKHIYEDNTSFFFFDKTGAALETKTPDIITAEYYPHWGRRLQFGREDDGGNLPETRRNGDGPTARFTW